MFITNQLGDLFFKEMEYYYLYISYGDEISSPTSIMLHETILDKKRPKDPRTDTRLATYKCFETTKTVFKYLQLAAANLGNCIVMLPEDDEEAIESWCKSVEKEVSRQGYPAVVIKS